MTEQEPQIIQNVEDLKNALDELLVMTASAFILLMQLGFAFLENGLVRPKNSKNILIKNMFDACIACLFFWLVGYGFAFHGQEGAFMGIKSELLVS